METQQVVGLVLGGASLVGSCLCRIALSYLQVPLFRDFSSLSDHVKKAPDQRAQVLVEGRVQEKVSRPLYIFTQIADSSVVYVNYTPKETGPAVLVTATECAKVGEENGECETERVRKMELRPFLLSDTNGCSIEVEMKSIEETKGFKQLLQLDHEDKPKSSGQARSTIIREYLLLFGTPLVGYGEAVWGKHNPGSLLFMPTEVGSSVEQLCLPHSKTKAILKFFSVMLLVFGGSMIVFNVTPLLVRLFRQRFMCEQPALPPQGHEDEIY